jgi:hypothetical protein
VALALGLTMKAKQQRRPGNSKPVHNSCCAHPMEFYCANCYNCVQQHDETASLQRANKKSALVFIDV